MQVEYDECCSDKLEHLLIGYKNPKQNKNLSQPRPNRAH